MEKREECFDAEKKYVPLAADGSSGSPLPTAYFMVRGLLSSRVELGLPTDGPPEEQDVNIYLAHLLGAYAESKYFLEVAPYLSDYDQELFARLRDSSNDRLKYRVYRTNADHLLISIGLFTPEDRASRPLWWQASPQNDWGRGQAYYDYAASFGSSVFGRHSGVSEVLGKLSVGFEKYVRILRHLRGEYLHFLDQLSVGELYHLQKQAQSKGLEDLHNEFLDALRDYQREVSTEKRACLLALIQRIQTIDPHFHFDLP